MNMLTINGEINDVMAASLIRQILDISDINPKETITIYISSKGGKVTAGMAIYDVISFVPNPINTIAKGEVAGIATVILAAGTEGMRYAYKGSSISLGGFWVNGDVQFISKEIDSTVQKIFYIIAKHAKMWVEKVKEMASNETFIDVDCAKKCGLIDKII